MLVPSKIVLHCSDTEDSGTKSWGAIKRYHIEERGWIDIGYHFGIEMVDGTVQLLRGRPYWKRGAHCRAENRNFDSLGVCVVGKFDDEPPSAEVYAAVLDVLKHLCLYFWINPSDVYGHCEFEPGKTCPGKMWDLEALREDLRNLVPAVDEDSGVIIRRMT